MLDLPGENQATVGDWYERLLTGLRDVCVRGSKHIELDAAGDDTDELMPALEHRIEELAVHMRRFKFLSGNEVEARECMAECFELLILLIANQNTVPMLDVFRESVRTLHERWEGLHPPRHPDGTPL